MELTVMPKLKWIGCTNTRTSGTGTISKIYFMLEGVIETNVVVRIGFETYKKYALVSEKPITLGFKIKLHCFTMLAS